MDGLVQDPNEGKAEAVRPGRLVDAFRYFYPDRPKAFTVSATALDLPLAPGSDAKPICFLKCWNTVTGARQTNYGTRIDYVLVDPGLLDESIVSCE